MIEVNDYLRHRSGMRLRVTVQDVSAFLIEMMSRGQSIQCDSQATVYVTR